MLALSLSAKLAFTSSLIDPGVPFCARGVDCGCLPGSLSMSKSRLHWCPQCSGIRDALNPRAPNSSQRLRQALKLAQDMLCTLYMSGSLTQLQHILFVFHMMLCPSVRIGPACSVSSKPGQALFRQAFGTAYCAWMALSCGVSGFSS